MGFFPYIAIFEGIYWEHVYEAVQDFTPRPGWAVLDLGANIGMYAVRVAKMVGDNGRVIAVEPHPRNYSLLLRNLSQNMLRNVLPHNAAVSDHEGTSLLFLSGLSSLHSLMKQSQTQSLAVRTVTVDKLVEESGTEVNLIKIDVEGAELLVLKGAKRTLQRPGVRFVIETHTRDLAMNVTTLLKPYCRFIISVDAFKYYHIPPTIYAITGAPAEKTW